MVDGRTQGARARRLLRSARRSSRTSIPRRAIFQEEIFGPVLAVTKARDFEHALELANDSQYGLTGAVYSQRPASTCKQAREHFFVGNLYFNRKCTGAMVGAHPVRRIQYVGHGFEGRRPRLSAAVFAGQGDGGEGGVRVPLHGAMCHNLTGVLPMETTRLSTKGQIILPKGHPRFPGVGAGDGIHGRRDRRGSSAPSRRPFPRCQSRRRGRLPAVQAQIENAR